MCLLAKSAPIIAAVQDNAPPMMLSMRLLASVRCALVAALLASAAVGTALAGYDTRPEVRDFAEEVAARHDWAPQWVLAQLQQARLLPATQRLVMPAPAGRRKNWAAYRDRFVEPDRIAAGVGFWLANSDALARAERDWGVPAQIVVGIIGVESFYGRITGNFRVLDALATLAFDFPQGRSDRSGFFRGELEEFLVFLRRERLAPDAVRGSYAGAIGLPQFMPGSLNRYAVDYDGDGRIDLGRSGADAIGSVARFLAEHGWQRGLAPTFEVDPPSDPAARARLLEPDIVPSFSAAEMRAAGATLPDAAQDAGPLALVSVDNGEAVPSFVAGTRNFFVLTRYNRSSYYARAVLDLGAAVQAALPGSTARSSS